VLRSTNFGFTAFICSRLSASMLCSLRRRAHIARPASNLRVDEEIAQCVVAGMPAARKRGKPPHGEV